VSTHYLITYSKYISTGPSDGVALSGSGEARLINDGKSIFWYVGVGIEFHGQELSSTQKKGNTW